MLSRIWIVLPIHNVKTHKQLILSLSIALFFFCNPSILLPIDDLHVILT
ncbi:hypothetical protein OIU79_007017 [Salix purpurea]|uniref:Uncharacterized protein n=1 Tax=Salix purpurea TaxID=77065 RepID=A0A9Q0TWT0_SALPP|nr:hypothetical protein OIU79_007017 [Salix purpurea]